MEMAQRKSRTKKQHRDLGDLKNRKMNDETYRLRRMVMDSIYKLKKVDPDLPRIQVRVLDGKIKSGNNVNTEAVAYVNADAIFVMDSAIESYDEVTLFSIVAHEVVHASYGARHVKDKKDLMYPYVRKFKSDAEVLKHFKNWFDKFQNNQIETTGVHHDDGKFEPWYVV